MPVLKECEFRNMVQRAIIGHGGRASRIQILSFIEDEAPDVSSEEFGEQFQRMVVAGELTSEERPPRGLRMRHTAYRAND